MELEGSVPCSQQPIIGSHNETNNSSQHPHSLSTILLDFIALTIFGEHHKL